MARRAKKVKTVLQAQTQLFVYGLFIYNRGDGMGTFNSVDVISQHYKLRMDLYVSSYASLAAETIERSRAPYNYQLLQFVLEGSQLMSSRSYVKVHETIWFYRII